MCLVRQGEDQSQWEKLTGQLTTHTQTIPHSVPGLYQDQNTRVRECHPNNYHSHVNMNSVTTMPRNLKQSHYTRCQTQAIFVFICLFLIEFNLITLTSIISSKHQQLALQSLKQKRGHRTVNLGVYSHLGVYSQESWQKCLSKVWLHRLVPIFLPSTTNMA